MYVFGVGGYESALVVAELCRKPVEYVRGPGRPCTGHVPAGAPCNLPRCVCKALCQPKTVLASPQQRLARSFQKVFDPHHHLLFLDLLESVAIVEGKLFRRFFH